MSWRLSRAIPWIVGGAHIHDLPWADAAQLKNRLALHPCKMGHLGRHGAVCPRRKHPRCPRIKTIPRPEIDDALDDRDSFCLWMPMRKDSIAVWQPEPHREQTLLGGITLQDSHLRAGRQ